MVIQSFSGRALFIGWLIVIATSAASLQAALTPYWQPVPITPQAIASDPALADQQTWSLRVTLDEGFWHVGGMRVTLPAGEVFYNHPLGNQTRPPDAAVALFPALAYDTYVTSPREQVDGTAPHVRTGHPNELEPPSLGGPTDTQPGIFSVNWIMFGPHGGPGPGDYEIARLTFPNDVFATVLTTGPSPSYTLSVSPDQLALIPPIPEPAGLAMLVATVPLLAARRAARVRTRPPEHLARVGTARPVVYNSI